MPPKTTTTPKFYTVTEAAPLVGMSRSSLYRAIQDGTKVAYRVMPNGVIRFAQQDIDDTLKLAHRTPLKTKRAA